MDFDPNEDFELGAEMPGSDEEEVYAAEKEYDDLNDETFGGDVEPIPEDLSAFAADSLALKLEDTGLNNFSSSAYNRAPSPSTKPGPSNSQMAKRGALTLEEIEYEQLMRTGSVHLGNLFPLTPGHRMPSMNIPSSSHVANVHLSSSDHSNWVHPPLHDEPQKQFLPTQTKKVVTAEDLERRLLEEYSRAKTQEQKESPKPSQPPAQGTSENAANPMTAMFPQGLPPMNPMQMAQMQQYFQWQQAMAAAAMASGGNAPSQMPPGFPPMMPPMPPFGPPNPAMLAAMMRMPLPPGFPPPQMGSLTPRFGMPQMNPLLQQQRSQTGTPNNGVHPQGGVMPPPSWPLNFPMNRNSNSGCASPSGSTASRRTRKEGMPSLRTITDFAVDPYAGFMSKKEREWLIKIQLIQCLGTGDKYNDDFYYTHWKKNNTLEKLPEAWKQPKIKSKYYNLEETYPSVYNPPSFSGVLGKPSNATTSYPRQVLDLHSADDDVESIVGSGTREVNKRKLRTILLSIEDGYMWQLECDDLLRKVPSVSPDEAVIMLNEIHSKLNAIYVTTMDEPVIPTTMVITKGRRLIVRVFSLATSQLKAQIISNVFNTLRKYARKVSMSPYGDFIQASLKALTEIKDADLKAFFEKTDAERFQDSLVYSSFSQNLFTTLLIACAKRSIVLDSFAAGSSINKFLQSDKKMYSGLGNLFGEIFASEDLGILKAWLQKSLLCTSNNVAGCFLVCLREKNF